MAAAMLELHWISSDLKINKLIAHPGLLESEIFA